MAPESVSITTVFFVIVCFDLAFGATVLGGRRGPALVFGAAFGLALAALVLGAGVAGVSGSVVCAVIVVVVSIVVVFTVLLTMA